MLFVSPEKKILQTVSLLLLSIDNMFKTEQIIMGAGTAHLVYRLGYGLDD
jgi:hypothetical protein